MLFHPPEQSPNQTDFGASGSFRKVHQTTLRQALAAGSDHFWLRPLTTSLQSQHPAPTQPTHRFSCRKQGLSRLRFHGKSVDSRSSAWLPRMRLCMSYLYAPGAINETSFSKLGFFHVPRWRMPSRLAEHHPTMMGCQRWSDGVWFYFRLWVMSGRPTPSVAQFKFTLARFGAHRVAKTWLELRSRTLFDLQRQMGWWNDVLNHNVWYQPAACASGNQGTIYFPNICSDLILIQEHSMCPAKFWATASLCGL